MESHNAKSQLKQYQTTCPVFSNGCHSTWSNGLLSDLLVLNENVSLKQKSRIFAWMEQSTT
jgi:hypothetical protein